MSIGSSVAEDVVLAAFLSAPVDERVETESEHAEVEAAKVEASARGISHAEVMASLERVR